MKHCSFNVDVEETKQEREDFYKQNPQDNKTKADEMFEKIGFKKTRENDIEAQYDYDAIILGDRIKHTILFAKVGKIFLSYYNKPGEIKETMGMGLEELKAINQKVKELGWLDE